jgi:hypothetical protein
MMSWMKMAGRCAISSAVFAMAALAVESANAEPCRRWDGKVIEASRGYCSSIGGFIVSSWSDEDREPSSSQAPKRSVPAGELSIEHLSNLSVSAPVVDVSGKVAGGGEVKEFTVDGKPAPIGRDGRFTFKRAVPIGDSEITLAAIDEWGRTATAKISVSRTPAAERDNSFASPDPFAVKGKARPQALALIIGVEGYESTPAAEFAERDAKAFYDYATSALGVPETRIRLLTGQKARRLDIEKTVATWLVPQIGSQTEVFVFYSGHGLASDDGKDLFLLPYDGDRSYLAGSSIRRQDLIASIIAAKPKSVHMFLDTCYSGGTRTGETLVASIRPVMLTAKNADAPKGVTIHSASANDQVSSTLPTAKHGLFSYFLMRGLQGEADADGDRKITDEELHGFLAKNVPSSAAMQGRTQTPQLTGAAMDPLVIW